MKQSRALLHELLSAQKLAVLSTHESGQPYANLVAFACSDDLKWLYFATARSTRKFANLLEDARVALLISSSTNKEADFQEAMAATVVGSAVEVLGEERQSALTAYLAKHPYLEEFVRSPTCALVKVSSAFLHSCEKFSAGNGAAYRSMTYVFTADVITPKDLPMVGGKAYALAELSQAGFEVPGFLCISTDAYREYIDRTGLREKILLELHRKEFKDMRWEEIWDCATRIRNLFLRTPMTAAVKTALESAITRRFEGRAVVVRSSAPDEDTVAASFAGLHESYVHIRGSETILAHIQKVWASLWSDSALLYRRELGLDAARSAMAVVIQEMVIGEKSGVAFSRSPNESSQAVIEAVHGLNQGLVDGQVAPDRYVLDRDLQKIISHTPVDRLRRLVTVNTGIDFSHFHRSWRLAHR